jgi:transcriptional regulator with XRE-family HTH domain
MKVHEKVRFYREKKGIAQEVLAYKMGIEQSQYSRRESGQIEFKAEEILKIAPMLEVEPADLYADQTIVFNSTNQSGGYFGQYIQISDKLIEQFEARIREKDELIANLKTQLQNIKNNYNK